MSGRTADRRAAGRYHRSAVDRVPIVPPLGQQGQRRAATVKVLVCPAPHTLLVGHQCSATGHEELRRLRACSRPRARTALAPRPGRPPPVPAGRSRPARPPASARLQACVSATSRSGDPVGGVRCSRRPRFTTRGLGEAGRGRSGAGDHAGHEAGDTKPSGLAHRGPRARRSRSAALEGRSPRIATVITVGEIHPIRICMGAERVNTAQEWKCLLRVARGRSTTFRKKWHVHECPVLEPRATCTGAMACVSSDIDEIDGAHCLSARQVREDRAGFMGMPSELAYRVSGRS
jgi:hypothetical protein